MRPFLSLIGLCALGATTIASAQTSNTGPTQTPAATVVVVDFGRALRETAEGQAALQTLRALHQQRQATLDAKRETLIQQAEMLQQQRSILSEHAFQQRLAAYEEALRELQETFDRFREELATRQEEATQRLLVRLKDFAEQLGQQEGLTLAPRDADPPPSATGYTDTFIRRYDARSRPDHPEGPVFEFSIGSSF